MANVGVSSIKLIDSDGDAVDDGAGKLNVNASGSTVEISGHGIIISGAINLTDSAAQLLTISCKHVDIMANLSNTGIVYIGASGVDATTGIALYPGDVYSVDVFNLNILYAMSTVSGDDINVAVFT